MLPARRESELFCFMKAGENMQDKTIFELTANINGDKSVGMYYCGKRINTQNHIYGPQIRNHYLFVLVNEGEAVMYEKGNAVRSLSKHDLLVMCPGETVHYKASTPWSIQWIGLYGDAVGELLSQVGINGRKPVIKIGAYHEASSLFEQIYTEAQQRSASSGLKIMSHIYSFFAILLKEAEPAPASDYVSTAKGMIEYNLDQPLSVRMLSDSLNLDPSYFTRIFTKAEGISPKKFILNKKMESAKQLLKNTDASVLEISNSMGFFDQLYFSRIFRKTVGMSPTEYRKTIRDKNK